MIALALILAWTISSPDISEFFAVPEWCPSSVPSAMTFGSADNYVECWSNDVYTASWRVFRNGEDVTEHLQEQPTWDASKGKWHVQNALDSRSRTQHIEWEGEEAEIDLSPDSNADPEFVGSSRKDDRLEWTASRQFYDITTWDYVWIPDVAYTAESTGLETNRTFLGYAPKASRLTPQWLAATYAPFAAWCERVYYFNEGQESDWDEDTYGPAATGTFRFSLPPSSYSHPAFVYEPDTNRAIRTRRLIEFDNLKNLMDSIKMMYLNSNFNIERPGWWSDPDGGSWKTILHGGTLLEQTFPNFKELPTVAWTSDPTTALASNVWHDTAITFDSFPGGGNLSWQGANLNNIPRLSMDALSFGEDWAYDEYHMFEHGLEWFVQLDQDIETVFSNAFVKSEGCAFDPSAYATRRLDMRDFALVDQVLAALDVTYNELDPTYYRRANQCSGEANGMFLFDQIFAHVSFDETGTAYLDSEEYLSGADLAQVAYTNRVDFDYWTDDFAIRVEPNSNHHEFSAECGDVYGDQIAHIESSTVIEMISWLYGSFGSSAGTCSVHSVASGISGNNAVFALVAVDDQTGINANAFAEASLATQVRIDTTLDVNRNYLYHTPKDLDFGNLHGVLHPGARGWDRSEVKLWSGMSYLRVKGSYDHPVTDIERFYDAYLDCSSKYAFDLTSVGSLSATESEMDSALSKMHTEMDREMRATIPSYDNAAVVVPIRREFYSSMISHTRYAAGTKIKAVPEALPLMSSGVRIERAIFERRGESATVRLILEDGSVIDVPEGGFDIGTISYAVETPTEDSTSPGPELIDEYGASVLGKYNFWTKVKWNWNALRLNWD